MSSRAYIVDLIHSIGEKTALVDHLEEKTDSKEALSLAKKVSDLRREQMNQLLALGEKPNPEYWCAFKHSIKAWVMDCEVYEATESEESLKNMIESSNILASVISLFLGMEFEDCARCLYDRLLVKQIENTKTENK